MRDYKIIKSDLGYNIYREKDGIRERLQRNSFTLNRTFARTFYHLDDAISALQIVKFQGEKIELNSLIEKKEFERKLEKKSWAEL